MNNVSEERARTFNWQFDDVPVTAMWHVFADTARFNEANGFPKHEIDEITQPDGSVQFVGRAKLGPMTLKWDDYPQNWIDERWFRHLRVFRSGPVRSLCATFEILDADEGSSSRYTIEIEPANWLGRILLRLGVFRAIEQKFTRLAKSAAEYCRGNSDLEFEFKKPTVSRYARHRIEELVEQIEATPYGHGLASELANYVLTRPDVDVMSIRPLRLASLWGRDERHVVELCLEAVKCGMLRLRWDLLCPRCQVGKLTVESLKELPDGAHCSSCNIDFKQEFSKNVELAFHPSRAIRTVEPGEFCFMGPMATPHIKAQLTVGPGESRTEAIALDDGAYRLRTLEPGGEVELSVTDGVVPLMGASDKGVSIEHAVPSTKQTLVLRNSSSRQLTFVLESLAWRHDALTAQRATMYQVFRDLFNDEILRPGDDVEIDSITIMFTDLKGSTSLYDRIGDPQAYVLVREHFVILGKAVRECNGSIVKMIGDAVMAVFNEPADGLVCARRIHADISRFNMRSGKEPLTIKLGLHTGRCISVTLNDKLDYYGSAANMAARLQGQSEGGDIVMSAEFIGDPAVNELLEGYEVSQEEVLLKGFEKPVPFFRLGATNC